MNANNYKHCISVFVYDDGSQNISVNGVPCFSGRMMIRNPQDINRHSMPIPELHKILNNAEDVVFHSTSNLTTKTES